VYGNKNNLLIIPALFIIIVKITENIDDTFPTNKQSKMNSFRSNPDNEIHSPYPHAKRLPPTHLTTRAVAADQDGHPAKVKTIGVAREPKKEWSMLIR
jgi:hypothetical protein